MPALTWDEICADRSLVDLPYKIETNRYGQIVMSPAKFWHSSRQGLIAHLLGELGSQGMGSTETAIETTEGVKVAGVAWATRAFFHTHKDESALSAAPSVCVEVLSDSNTTPEMEAKILLYFAYGAEEVWLCHDDGRMTFHISPTVTVPASQLFPEFPCVVGADV